MQIKLFYGFIDYKNAKSFIVNYYLFSVINRKYILELTKNINIYKSSWTFVFDNNNI